MFSSRFIICLLIIAASHHRYMGDFCLEAVLSRSLGLALFAWVAVLVARPIMAINGTVEGPVVVNALFCTACFADSRLIRRPLLLGAFGLSLAFSLAIRWTCVISHWVLIAMMQLIRELCLKMQAILFECFPSV